MYVNVLCVCELCLRYVLMCVYMCKYTLFYGNVYVLMK